jgi:enoyl-CoA hydratase
LSGHDAERIGLVSLCVKDAALDPKSLEIARGLAAESPSAVRWTKYALNNWLKLAGLSFDS